MNKNTEPTESNHASRPITLLAFADSVRAALIDFGHTGNLDLVKTDDLHDIYAEACDAIGQETNLRGEQPFQLSELGLVSEFDYERVDIPPYIRFNQFGDNPEDIPKPGNPDYEMAQFEIYTYKPKVGKWRIQKLQVTVSRIVSLALVVACFPLSAQTNRISSNAATTGDFYISETGSALDADNEARLVPRMAGEATLTSRVTPSSGGSEPSRGLGVLNAACPQSVLTPAPPVKSKQEPKISPAEMFVRLIEERRVAWKEPDVLVGNDLKSRIWGAQH